MQNISSESLRTKLGKLLSATRQGFLAGHPLDHVRVTNTRKSHELATLADQPGSGVTRVSVPVDPTERVRFVRKWMAKHQRKLAGGALASTLVLPMLAQAAEGEMVAVGDLNGVAATEELADGGLQIIFEDGRVVQLGADHVQMMGEQVAVDAQALQSALEAAVIPVEQVEGVESTVLNDDGSATITMEDGQRMLIEPGAMQVQSGQVVMTEAQISGAGLGGNYSFSTPLEGAAMSSGASASTSSSSASGDTVLGGLTGAQLAMGAAGVGVVAALASSDSSSSSAPAPTEAPTEAPPETASGNAQDGYIVNANVVFLDAEGNEIGSTTTSAEDGSQGDFEAEVDGVVDTIEVRGGTDIATGKAFAGVLKAPGGSEVVSPLTTLIQAQVAQGRTVEEAEANVRESLGLSDLDLGEGKTLLNFDAWGEDSPAGQAVAKAGIQVATLIQVASANEDNTGVDEDRFTTLMEDFATRLSEGRLDLSDPDTYENNVKEFLTSNGVAEEQATKASQSSNSIRASETREEAADVQRDNAPGDTVLVNSGAALAEAQALELRASLQERLADDITANLSADRIDREDLDALIAYREAIQQAVELAEAGDAQAFFNGDNAPDLTAILNNLAGLSVDGNVFTQANADTAIAIVNDVDALAASNPAQLNAFAEVAFTTLTGGVDAAQFSEMLGELATQLNDESISIGGLSLDAQSVTQLQTLFDGLGSEAQAVALASAQDLQINELLDPQAFFTEAFAEALKLEVESNSTLSGALFEDLQASLVSFIEKVGQLDGAQFEAADFADEGLVSTLANEIGGVISVVEDNPDFTLPGGVSVDGDTVSFNGLSLSVSQLDSAVIGYGNLNAESQETYLENLNNPSDLSLLTDLGSALETQVVQNIASETAEQTIVLGEGDYEGVAGVISGSGDDSITGSVLDNTIDISAGGSDTITFAASQTENGTDTVTGFSVGDTADGGDVIAFEGLPSGLGSGYEVNPDSNLDADTGLLVFSTTAGPEASTLGLTEGDTVMVLEVADNGTDAQLLKVEVGADDSTTSEQLATFEGLGGNLGNIVDENLQDFNLTNT